VKKVRTIESNACSLIFETHSQLFDLPHRMAGFAPTISQHAAVANERLASIRHHGDEQSRCLQDQRPFDGSRVWHELEGDLDELRSTFKTLSKDCLRHLFQANGQIQQFEISLDHVEGSLAALRTNVGHQMMSTRPVAPPKATDAAFPQARPMVLDLPESDFRINAHVLKGVGRQSDSEPLIRPVPKGGKPPDFWSQLSDYFIPTGSPLPETFETSFSTAYGFDASDCLTEVAEEQRLAAEAAKLAAEAAVPAKKEKKEEGRRARSRTSKPDLKRGRDLNFAPPSAGDPVKVPTVAPPKEAQPADGAFSADDPPAQQQPLSSEGSGPGDPGTDTSAPQSQGGDAGRDGENDDEDE
jgi:hypothetical protein